MKELVLEILFLFLWFFLCVYSEITYYKKEKKKHEEKIFTDLFTPRLQI